MVENSPADPLALMNTPVASWDLASRDGWGGFYTSLTRDDEMGLWYNLTTNRINWETPATGALLITTNLGGQTFLTTSNLNSLLTAIPTNDPATFGTLFPNVVLAGSTTNCSIVTNWNVVYGTNLLNGAPFGTAVPTVSSNIVGTSWQATYGETFANVVTNGNINSFQGVYLNGNTIHLQYATNSTVYIVTVLAYAPHGSPVGTVVTNSFTNKIVMPVASGEYLTLPASQCGWQFDSSLSAYTPTVVSNSLPIPTNTVSSTNFATPVILSQYSLSFFTNHTFLVHPITCGTATPTAGFYQGVEKMQFVRANYDSLLGQFFRPVTNNYSAVLITNSQMVRQYFPARGHRAGYHNFGGGHAPQLPDRYEF